VDPGLDPCIESLPDDVVRICVIDSESIGCGNSHFRGRLLGSSVSG